jgi:glucose-1-phosphate thymidylyltransferase
MVELWGLIVALDSRGDELARALCGGPACALPVANRTLLDRALRAARGAGAERVAIAAVDGARAVAEAAAAAAGSGVTVLGVGGGIGLAGALAAAVGALAGASVFVHHADGLLAGGLGGVGWAGSGGAVRVVASSDAIVLGGGGARSDDVETAPALMLGGDALRAAAALAADAGMAAVLDAVRRAGGRVEARAVAGAWRHTGSVEGLLEANRLVLDGVERSVSSEATVSDARIEGRVVVHPTAIVERATIRGPAIIGAGATIVDAFVGPYSAIGDRVRLQGAEVEHSILLAGASVRHIGTRLAASVIGPDASVGRDFSLPAVLRVRVGRGAEVTLG